MPQPGRTTPVVRALPSGSPATRPLEPPSPGGALRAGRHSCSLPAMPMGTQVRARARHRRERAPRGPPWSDVSREPAARRRRGGRDWQQADRRGSGPAIRGRPAPRRGRHFRRFAALPRRSPTWPPRPRRHGRGRDATPIVVWARLLLESVANPSHRFDVAPQITELLAQTGDLDVDRAFRDRIVLPFDGIDDLIAREGPAGLARQELQQAKFGEGQLEG